MDRRTALSSLLGVSIAPCLCSSAHARTSGTGCFISAASLSAFNNEFLVQTTTGLSYLDANIEHEANLMMEVFRVRPGLTYFVEPASMGGNAFATSERYFSPTHDGTILLGLRLMQSEMDASDGNGQHRITCVMAHEFAHIFQAKLTDLRNRPQTWRELHADFLAGWYLGYRSVEGLKIGSHTTDALFEKGDYAFNDPNHHGIPVQRLVMGLEGWRFARTQRNWRRVSSAAAFGASRLRPNPSGGWDVVPSINLE